MGEFNVNKSDGSLEQTAGMPSEYPATQVMMPDGTTTVADALPKVTDWYTVPNDITVNSAGYGIIAGFSNGWSLPADFDGNRIICVQATNMSGTQKPIMFDVVNSRYRIDGVLGQAGTIYAGLKIRLIYI